MVAIRYSQQEGLLNQVFGVMKRAEQPVAVELQLAAVALEQSREGSLVVELVGHCPALRVWFLD